MYLLLYINITRPLIANAHGINVYQRHCMRNTWHLHNPQYQSVGEVHHAKAGILLITGKHISQSSCYIKS